MSGRHRGVVGLCNFRAVTRQDAFAMLDDTDRTFLRSLAETFGKPSAIAIRFADGARFDSGTFTAAQDFADFAQRCAKPLYQRKRK